MSLLKISENIYSVRENARLLSILLLFVLSQLYDPVRYLAISWIIIVIVLGNVKRINRENPIFYFIRMTLYFAAYLLPFLIDSEVVLISKKCISKIIIGCIVAVIINFVRLKKISNKVKVMLSKELIVDSYKDPLFTIIMRIYNLIGAAICEELLFRLYILSLGVPKVVSFSISVIFFILSHYLLIWGGEFKRTDYCNQFVYGVINAILFLEGGSIIPCILMHFLYNSLEVFRNIKIIDRHYIHPERYKINTEEIIFKGKEL